MSNNGYMNINEIIEFKKYLLISAEALAVSGSKNITEVNSNIITYIEYQKTLFDACYPYKCHFDHVNWFSATSTYIPVGWYNLGGVKSDESDKIGELIEIAWQMWRMSLLKNMELENIKPINITHKTAG